MKQNILLFLLLLLVLTTQAQKNQFQPTTNTLYFGDENGSLGNIHRSKIEVKGYTGQPYEIKFEDLKFGYEGKYYQLNVEDLYYFNPLEFWKNNEHTYLNRNRDSIHTYLDWGISRMYIQPNNTKIDSLESYDEQINKYGFLNEEILENGKVKRHVVDAKPFFQPFYFKKTEVTNWEYRQFTNYVRDSLAHEILGDIMGDCDGGNEFIDWEAEIDWSPMALEELFSPQDGFSDQRKINTDTLSYGFKPEHEGWKSIKIYPDTVCWLKDHQYTYNEPTMRNFFWHPAFNNHPVVGINYHQAMAYCHWLEQQINYRYRNTAYKFKVNLPTAYQWQWMAWNESGKRNRYIVDEDWNPDLMMTYESDNIAVLKARRPNDYIAGNFTNDGAFYTHSVNAKLGESPQKGFFQRFKKKALSKDYFQNTDVNGISGMGGNVSEWMRENYTDNWKVAFERYIKYLQEDESTPDVVSQIALYYNEKHGKDGDKNTKGQLVYGANWLDERYNIQTGKNKAGIFAKTFVPRNQAYSTLGFRYVIEVSMKE